MNDENLYGYLTWWSVGEVRASYRDLNALAAQVGFPLDCVPTPPPARHAWEKATNVGGARGLKVDVPADLRNQVFIEHGVDPQVRLIVRRVSDKAPLLVRHLIREVVIPTAAGYEQQLSLDRVAVLEFDCNTNQAASDVIHDRQGWVNGNVHSVLAEMDIRRQQFARVADGNDVREGVRALLFGLFRVALRGTGGVYFVPQSAPDAEARLKALRAYIKGLQPWKVGQVSPSCNVVRLHGEDAENLKDDIIASAVAEFKERLSKAAGRVDGVLKGSVTGKLASKVANGAFEDLLGIKLAIAAYRDSLGADLQALDDILSMTQTMIVKAAGMGE